MHCNNFCITTRLFLNTHQYPDTPDSLQQHLPSNSSIFNLPLCGFSSIPLLFYYHFFSDATQSVQSPSHSLSKIPSILSPQPTGPGHTCKFVCVHIMPPSRTVQEIITQALLLAEVCPGIPESSEQDCLFDTFRGTSFISPQD